MDHPDYELYKQTIASMKMPQNNPQIFPPQPFGAGPPRSVETSLSSVSSSYEHNRAQVTNVPPGLSQGPVSSAPLSQIPMPPNPRENNPQKLSEQFPKISPQTEELYPQSGGFPFMPQNIPSPPIHKIPNLPEAIKPVGFPAMPSPNAGFMPMPEGNPQPVPNIPGIPAMPSPNTGFMPIPGGNRPIPNIPVLPAMPSPNTGFMPMPGGNPQPVPNIPGAIKPSGLPAIPPPNAAFMPGGIPNIPMPQPKPNASAQPVPKVPGIPQSPISAIQQLPNPGIPQVSQFNKLPSMSPAPIMQPSPNQFPPPSNFNQPNPNFSISSSEASISSRVSLSDQQINKANNDGRIAMIAQKAPLVRMVRDNAGPGQDFINLFGPTSQVFEVRSSLQSMDPSPDSQWYFLHESGEFIPYDQNVNPLIEQAFKNGNELIEIKINQNQYYTIVFGREGNQHSQVSQGGYIYRTVRRGRGLAQADFGNNDVIWYWSDEVSGDWKQYEPEACKLIEDHYQSFLRKNLNVRLSRLTDEEREIVRQKESALVWGTSGFSYMIDFVNMVQLNERTKRWRGIKRGNDAANFRVSKIKQKGEIPWIEHPVLK